MLEDIIDSGKTLGEIYRIFKNENVKQLKIATLFFKPEAYKKDFKLHYIGIEIPDKFIDGKNELKSLLVDKNCGINKKIVEG